MAGPWEQYAKAAPEGPWTAYATKPPEQPAGVVEDVVKSIPGAIPRASAALVGLPQSLLELGGKGVGYLLKKTGMNPAAVDAAVRPELPNIGDTVKRGYDEAAKLVTGKPVYQPQTGPGRIADLTAQTMVGGPGSMTQKAVTGLAAGTAGEAGRTITDNPIAIAVFQMLGAGAASLPFILRSVPAENIQNAIQGITPQKLAQAQALMDEAARRGAPLTGAEAIAQVTGKNSLQDIQRVVESSAKGAPVIQPMMNNRAAATRAAVEQQLDTVAPMPAEPSRTPVRMQQAAEKSITNARQAGNAAAGPSYAQAATESIPANRWNTLTTQPAAQKALSSVKAATEYGVTMEREGSIRWLDAAKKWLDAKIQSPNTTPAERRIWEQGRTAIINEADAASSAYRQGRTTVARNMRDTVNPMQESPVGDIANLKGIPAEHAMRAQSEILMPQAPRALNPATIQKTIATIGQQDPGAARDFVRQNVQAIFDEAAQNLSSGTNQWGGAKFASQVAGNPRQRENLRALIESSSDRTAWNGFNRLLEVLEAQGKRHAPGSQTAQNLRVEGQLSMGGAGALPATVASPNKAMSMIGEWYDNFRFGKNTEEMARILTDPNSVMLMRKLASEAPNSARAAALTAQIIASGSGRSDAQSSTNR